MTETSEEMASYLTYHADQQLYNCIHKNIPTNVQMAIINVLAKLKIARVTGNHVLNKITLKGNRRRLY